MGKEDRRIRMTKKMIKESFIELMQEHQISKITVKMICELADINRSTFYSHYSDQYDLLSQIQQEAIADIQKSIMNRSFIIDQHTIAVPALIEILGYAKSNRPMFLALLSESNLSNFQSGLIFLAQEKAIEEHVEEALLAESTSRYLEIFVISGIISMMKEWLSEGCIDEIDKLAELISDLLFQGVGGLYRG